MEDIDGGLHPALDGQSLDDDDDDEMNISSLLYLSSWSLRLLTRC